MEGVHPGPADGLLMFCLLSSGLESPTSCPSTAISVRCSNGGRGGMGLQEVPVQTQLPTPSRSEASTSTPHKILNARITGRKVKNNNDSNRMNK